MTKIQEFVKQYGTEGAAIIINQAINGSEAAKEMWDKEIELKLIGALIEVVSTLNREEAREIFNRHFNK